ncbi:protein of unknown function [Kyrpidia spormannii]|uniref:Uncharacterized protein n=1 Tax=Kyrpidia spormannii TaxID=2055160 RepID=A0A6F9E9Q5_9BACL|nr:protein of unknown function [Kyrpidia spormannii]
MQVRESSALMVGDPETRTDLPPEIVGQLRGGRSAPVKLMPQKVSVGSKSSLRDPCRIHP